MRRLREFYNKIFYGRNGFDAYSIMLLAFSFLFLPYKYIFIIGIALIGYSFYRAFSRNITKRQQELYKFSVVMYKIGTFLQRLFAPVGRFFKKLKLRSKYKFLKCPECKAEMKVPKNAGKIRVTCPKCYHKFVVKA